MTEQLHRLIDGGADQRVINERLSGILEANHLVLTDHGKRFSDHERRIRFLERAINYGLGAAGLVSAGLYLVSVFKS